jgi:phenylacetate-CoA ligase
VWADVVARSIRASGGRAGMKVHVAYGYGLFTGGLGAHYGAERLGCTVIPMSGGMTERQVQLLQDFAPDIIMVTPSYMLAILDEFRARGIDPRTTSLKVGIFGAEPWTDAMRGEIEDAFAMHAVDIYGLSEVMGPGVANECVETKDGLHIWEDHFYPEVIDPETGAVLPDGEKGELVFTSLSKEAMPVIRYRTRDLTRLLPGHRPLDAADGEDHRPLRRHADRARRQPLPDPGRGAGAALPGPVGPLPDRADA